MTEYKRVRVVGAPGFEDFEGDLITEMEPVKGWPICFIEAEWEGVLELEAIPSRFVFKV